ncbi:MAG: biotin--[acetyl-CoA-carboxylase] ligase [Paracoccaceae bacterium]|nr:biotin--[acetyl-CoA-carboxylase] ligase [Paracoccaceae bacterium]
MARWPEGVHKLVLDRCESTMAEAARHGPGLRGPLWILALEQTGGRGRQGRAWLHPAGNFAASLVWYPEGTTAQRALRSFVAALALRDACLEATGGRGTFTLKWPNDVLLNGGKLAGILLESGDRWLSVGFGVNLAEAPMIGQTRPDAPMPVSLAAETGAEITPRDFLPLLASAQARREAQFLRDGFAATRRDWLENAARLNEPLTARLAGREITGIFQTVDEDGMLVLKAADEEHRIAAADIFFPPR